LYLPTSDEPQERASESIVQLVLQERRRASEAVQNCEPTGPKKQLLGQRVRLEGAEPQLKELQRLTILCRRKSLQA